MQRLQGQFFQITQMKQTTDHSAQMWWYFPESGDFKMMTSVTPVEFLAKFQVFFGQPIENQLRVHRIREEKLAAVPATMKVSGWWVLEHFLFSMSYIWVNYFIYLGLSG